MIKFAAKKPPMVVLHYTGRNYNTPNTHIVKSLKIPNDNPEDSGVWKGEMLILENVYSSPILGNVSFSLESGNVYNNDGEVDGDFFANSLLKLGSEESYVSGSLSISISNGNEESVYMDEFIVLIHFRGNMYKKAIEIIERNIEERNNEF